MLINVIIIKAGGKNYKKLYDTFSAYPQYFTLNDATYDNVWDTQIGPDVAQDDRPEIVSFLSNISKYSTSNNLIIKDTSRMLCEVEDLVSFITECMSENVQIAYLAHWQNICESDINTTTKLTFTTSNDSPKSFQALFISNVGCMKIIKSPKLYFTSGGCDSFLPIKEHLGAHLNKFVVHGALKSWCVSPHPFVYDNVQQEVQPKAVTDTIVASTDNTYLYILLGLGGLLILLWLFFR